MTKNVATLDYKPTSDPGQWIATLNVDTSSDTDWIINAQVAVQNASDNLTPGFVMVDNMANNGLLSVNVGPYGLTIPQYTRKTIALPAGTQTVEIKGTVGTVACYFTTKTPGVPDDTNQYQINQALAPKAVFTPKAIIANAAQATTDLNCYIEFSAANPITYSLLQAATVTPGFYNPRLLNAGSSTVTIKPYAGDQLNSLYTSAAPLVLNPGDSVDLFCDGSQWQSRGEITYDSGPIAFTANAQGGSLTNHNFQQKPQILETYVRALQALNGFAVGEEYMSGPDATYGGGNGQSWGLSASIDASVTPFSINYRVGANGLSFMQRATGVIGTWGANQAALIVRARLRL